MSMWLDYLDSLEERDRMSYDGCCGCYNCQRIRNDFKAYELANTADEFCGVCQQIHPANGKCHARNIFA